MCESVCSIRGSEILSQNHLFFWRFPVIFVITEVIDSLLKMQISQKKEKLTFSPTAQRWLLIFVVFILLSFLYAVEMFIILTKYAYPSYSFVICF